MRQVLSWRLLAAVGALVALAVVVTLAFTGRDSIAEITEPDEPTPRVADVAALVLDTQVRDFSIGPDGRSTGDLVMKLAPPYDVTVRVFPGTPGSNTCQSLGEFGLCSLLAELHGGYAQLVDGWRVPYAEIIDRAQCDSPAESFPEFLRLNGTNHRSVFSI